MARRGGRAALALGATLAALLGAELALRAMLPTLPSLRAAERAGLTLEVSAPRWTAPNTTHISERCDTAAPTLVAAVDAHVQREGRAGPDAGEPLRLVVVGDSFTQGVGAEDGVGYVLRLAEGLAASTGRPVLWERLGATGADLCQTMATVTHRLDREPAPDLLLVQLFVDDLYQRRAFLAGDRLILVPHAVRSRPLRWLVTRSYAANAAWATLAPRLGDAGATIVDPHDRSILAERLAALPSRPGGPRSLVFLVRATGQAQCPERPDMAATCEAWSSGGDLIAQMARGHDAPFVDLRDLWGDDPALMSPRERGGPAIPVHPSSAGHLRLADALLPHVEAELARP